MTTTTTWIDVEQSDNDNNEADHLRPPSPPQKVHTGQFCRDSFGLHTTVSDAGLQLSEALPTLSDPFSNDDASERSEDCDLNEDSDSVHDHDIFASWQKKYGDLGWFSTRQNDAGPGKQRYQYNSSNGIAFSEPAHTSSTFPPRLSLICDAENHLQFANEIEKQLSSDDDDDNDLFMPWKEKNNDFNYPPAANNGWPTEATSKYHSGEQRQNRKRELGMSADMAAERDHDSPTISTSGVGDDHDADYITTTNGNGKNNGMP